MAWLAVKWKSERTPLFFELNAIPKTSLIWVVQPLIIPFVVLVAFCLHWVSPMAGQQLHELAQQNLGEQVPVGTIEPLGGMQIGAEAHDGSVFSRVFVANDQMASLSQSAQMGTNGELELFEGKVYPLLSQTEWSLSYSHATVNRLSNGLKWTVHMHSSQKLRKLISSPTLQNCTVHIQKNHTSLGLWLLGLTVWYWASMVSHRANIGLSGCWWLPMRF